MRNYLAPLSIIAAVFAAVVVAARLSQRDITRAASERPLQRGLGLHPHKDPRSRDYRAVPRLVELTSVGRTRMWRLLLKALDQGREGACTGYAAAHEAAAWPVPVPGVTEETAKTLYRTAQAIDRAAGRHYPEGATMLALAKALVQLRYADGYRWCFGLKEVVLYLSHEGPVLFGILWFDGMYRAPNGKVTISGKVVGGHAILGRGVKLYYLPGTTKSQRLDAATWWDTVDLDRSYVTWRNSWGLLYGLKGEARISLRDLGRLLDDDGESLALITRRNPGRFAVAAARVRAYLRP